MSGKLVDKYAYDTSGYDKIVVNDIIKNKPTHMTSIFKEYLVFDEPIEFLKRVYSSGENKQKLRKLNDFHNTYFKVFPNFILLPEKYYMYKNIERKQRVIDDQQYRMLLRSEGEGLGGSKEKSQSNLFNESYMRHISTFRIKFNNEEVKEDKVDVQRLFMPHKLSICSSYSKGHEQANRIAKARNSIEMVLSNVNTSHM